MWLRWPHNFLNVFAQDTVIGGLRQSTRTWRFERERVLRGRLEASNRLHRAGTQKVDRKMVDGQNCRRVRNRADDSG